MLTALELSLDIEEIHSLIDGLQFNDLFKKAQQIIYIIIITINCKSPYSYKIIKPYYLHSNPHFITCFSNHSPVRFITMKYFSILTSRLAIFQNLIAFFLYSFIIKIKFSQSQPSTLLIPHSITYIGPSIDYIPALIDPLLNYPHFNC